MLIPFDEIQERYQVRFKNILHVGAHRAEEKDAYFSNGVESVIWVEANEELARFLRDNVSDEKNVIVNALVSDIDDIETQFNIANNGQSSSILNLGIHSSLFQDVHYCDKKTIKTKTINKIMSDLGNKKIDFINLDIQGAELLALKGSTDYLSDVKAIYTEINTEYVYQNCALVSEIDSFLRQYGFERVETKMWSNHPWGDALYLKRK
jgi:FkbM family methyltransferase